MSQTIVVQIGNSDNKLTQRRWANFIGHVKSELASPAVSFQFYGPSPGDAYWQNCCWVFNVDHETLGYESLESYLNDLRFMLSQAAARFEQDSIALLVGETEFVKYDYTTKEMFDNGDSHSKEDDQEGREEDYDNGQEGHDDREEGRKQGHRFLDEELGLKEGGTGSGPTGLQGDSERDS